MIITPTSLNITQLFGSTNEQYVIPTYQRRYSWHERQVWELIDDILLIDESDTHLLGSIVCLAGHHTAGLNRLELVDGQQRLTTVTIILECVRQRLQRDGETDEAAEVARLLSAKPLGGKALRKVSLDSIDSAEFDRLVHNIQDQPFQNHQLAGAFGIVRGWIAAQGLEQLGAFLYRLKNQAVVIRLDVSEAKDAFKLFETINNRGLKLSPTDIIKNFLLGNAARFGADPLQDARNSWASLIVHLDGTNPDAFFRYYLMALMGTRITASEVVAKFKNVFMSQVVEAAALPERHLYADPIEPVEATREAYRVLCPSDEKFRDEFASTSFPSNLIERARYCLERIEAARHGEHDELQVLGAADVHVEHIIPQKIKTKKAKEEFGDWVTYLGDKAESQHPKYVARIGNLTLFAGALNISASNNPFGMKKQAYKDSGILLTKELASMQHFKFKNVDQRSAVLAAKAVELWPMP